MEYIKAIGKRLGSILKQRKLTQAVLAKNSGVSRMTVNGIVRGRVKIISFEILLKLCKALDMTLWEFFDVSIFDCTLN